MDTKALRQKILDLAIRGKLVPQDLNDEPASVLLERIREQKQQMVKEGKLKAEDIKNDSVIFKGEDNLHYEKFTDGSVKCIEDEIPFELPKGWAWARLASLIELFITGPFGSALHKSDYVTDGIPLINPINIIDGKVIPVDKMQVSSETVKRLSSFKVATNDIVIARRGDMGRCAVVQLAQEGWLCGTGSFILRLPAVLCSEYFAVCLRSPYAVEHMSVNSIGNTMLNLNQTILKSILMPVPPCAEQNRIIKVIFDATHLLAKTAAHSEELAVCVAKAKAKILDLAIRGQLVPQDPNDEPASVLLERIRAEKDDLIKQGKIKRDKKESIIFKGEDNSYYEKVGVEIRCIDSEIPFEIPDGWMYERLGNICSIARGGSPRPIENYLTDDENGLNWIKIGDTEQGGKYIYSTKEKIRPEGLSKTRYVCSGDFLLTNSMSFGRPYILRTNGCIHDGWLVIGGIEIAFHQDYLYYMLSSSIMYNALSSLAVGSTVKNLKSDSVKSLLVPIPPLAEQACISRQIENYFATMLPIERSLS